MRSIYNHNALKDRRRTLRTNQTEAERKIWTILRNKQVLGCRFLRQYSVGRYIIDFYCPSLRVAIEIDGGQHNATNIKYDMNRTDYLTKQNISVIRYWNNEVLNNLEGVYSDLVQKIKPLLASPYLKGRESQVPLK